MSSKSAAVALVVASALSVWIRAQSPAPRAGVDWPAFRGIDASGIGEGAPTPAAFSPATAVWKTPIPGMGLSSPVIWGDLLCVTTALSETKSLEFKTGISGGTGSAPQDGAHEWKIVCLDKQTGAIRWERSVLTGVPKVRRHWKATYANATLATDGTHLAAMFGSEGLYVYDFQGTLRWKKDFGVLDAGSYSEPESQWGFASSPIIADGKVIIQADVQKDSFLTALDVLTGETVWRTPRADVPTWGTPTVVALNDRPQIVVNGWKHVGGYDLRTGRELWKLSGRGDLPVPTPVFGHGLIFITSTHGPTTLSPLYAIRASAAGDVSLADDQTSNPAVAWTALGVGGYATPLVYGDYLYIVRNNGVLVVFEARTGRRLYQQRLSNAWFTASPVANGGRVYFTSEEGEVFVLKAGPTYDLVAMNQLDAVCLATPAISAGRIFFRTTTHIMAFAGAR